MSKCFRVLLSLLMAVLIVSSASAWDAISITNTSDDWGKFTSKDNTLIISQDGEFSFNFGSTISLDNIFLSPDGTKLFQKVTITLPSGGIAGDWNITFPKKVSKDTRVTLIIKGTNTAIVASKDALSWDIGRSQDLVIDVPLRVNASSKNNLAVNLTVRDGGTATLDTNAAIYADKTLSSYETGYTKLASSYDVYAGGELTVKNQWALRGSKLTIITRAGTGTYSKTPATFNIDLPVNTINFGGRTSTSDPQFEAVGTKLSLDKAINFLNSLIIAPASYNSKYYGTLNTKAFKKSGSGAITLMNQALSDDVVSIDVEQGTLTFSGAQTLTSTASANSLSTWRPLKAAKVTVSKDASITVSSYAIEQKKDITFVIKGAATFNNRAVVSRDDKTFSEIYPHETYSAGKNMKIDALGTILSVDSGASVNINGFLAVKKLTGAKNSTITITGSGEDDAALIFVDPAAENYIDYQGKINGTKANVGLYVSKDTAPAYDKRIFRSADVDIDNLIIYGPASLDIDADTSFDKVSNIWLRSNRPGAGDNSKLKIGKLNFIPIKGEASVIEVENIKIDGTASADYMGALTIGKDNNVSLDVYLYNIKLYADRAGDFNNLYKNPYSPIYALKIDGTNQPSRFIIDGVEGASDSTEVANGIYQVQIMQSSDVLFTGTGTFYPIDKYNSLLVSQDAKLEIDNGGVIQGNLKFIKSSGTLPEKITDAKYPQDNDFVARGGWYSKDLYPYTTFSTHVNADNLDNSNTGVYAVKVTGKIEAEGGEGNIVVRTKADTAAFTASTAGQRFKVLGLTGTDSINPPVFSVSSNDVFGFVIAQGMYSDDYGVTVQTQTELATVNLDTWSFITGSDDFGEGTGHGFEIKIPFTVTVQGEQVSVNKEAGTSESYYLLVNNNKWHFTPYPVFLKEEDSEFLTIDDIIAGYKDKTLTTLRSDDIQAVLAFKFDTDGKPYLSVSGTSYSGENPVDVSIALYLEKANEDKDITWLKGVIPDFVDYQFIRSGSNYGDQTGTSKLTATSSVDIEQDASGSVTFTVSNLYKQTVTTSSMPTLVNGIYIWKNGATTETWYMADETGSYVPVKSVTVLLYDEDTTTPKELTDATITSSGTSSTVSVPITSLGTTNGKLSATKKLAVRATRSEGVGTITTQSVSFTMHSTISSANKTALTALTKTVIRNGASVTARYNIPSSEIPSPVSYIKYGEMPSWLGFDSDTTGFGYTTTGNVAAGTYEFQILAYSGENSTSSTYKLYTFSVTVENGLVIAPSRSGVSMDVSAPASITLTATNNVGTMSYDVSISASGLTATVSGSTITFRATRPNSYDVTITGTDNGRTANKTAIIRLRVDVTDRLGTFSISMASTLSTYVRERVSLPITVTNNVRTVNYSSDAAPDRMSVIFSGDTALFTPLVSGSHTVKIRGTDTGRTTNNTSDATVTVTAAPRPAATDSGDFGLRASSTNVSITLPDTAAVTLSPVNLIGTVRYTANYDWVTFSGNTVTLAPTASGDYRVTIRATDSGRTTGNSDTVTITVSVKEAENNPPAPEAFSVTASSSTVNITAGSTETITLTPAHAIGTVSYKAAVSPEGLTVNFDGNTASITAPKTSSDYTVIITATDEGRTENNTYTVTITVSVKDPSVPDDNPPTPGAFSVTASTSTVNITSGSTTNITLTPANAISTVNYAYTSTPQGAAVTFTGNTAAITATTAGRYTVTITATDSGRTTGNTYTVTVTVTVTAGTTPDTPPDNTTTNPTTGQVTTPTIDVQNNSVTSKVLETLSEMDEDLEDESEVSVIPSSSWGEARTSRDLTASERAAIPSTQTPAKVFPLVRVAQSGVKLFGVDLSSLAAGTRVYLYVIPLNSATGSMIRAAAVESEACALFDENGNETDKVPASKKLNAAAYMEAGTTYSAVITTASSSGDSGSTGSSGGGCDSGFGVFALAVLGLFTKKRIVK